MIVLYDMKDLVKGTHERFELTVSPPVDSVRVKKVILSVTGTKVKEYLLGTAADGMPVGVHLSIDGVLVFEVTAADSLGFPTGFLNAVITFDRKPEQVVVCTGLARIV